MLHRGVLKGNSRRTGEYPVVRRTLGAAGADGRESHGVHPVPRRAADAAAAGAPLNRSACPERRTHPCNMERAKCNRQQGACNMERAVMQQTTGSVQHAACEMQHAAPAAALRKGCRKGCDSAAAQYCRTHVAIRCPHSFGADAPRSLLPAPCAGYGANTQHAAVA
jgi:hypothetical protein